jgi:small basic protein
MWLPVLSLIVGFLAVFLPFYVSHLKTSNLAEYAPYLAVAVIAGVDSIVGAIRSAIEGTFNDRVFVSGFFTNALLSAGVLYLGTALRQEAPIATAIMVALIIRLFNNLGFIRRYVVARLFEKRLTGEKSFPEP